MSKSLSQEQQRIVDTWGQGMAVLAGAGSGKTTTLVSKCAELLKRMPEARFAAVSFTEKSARDLKTKLTERLTADQGGAAPDSVMAGHWVNTIHGLCASIIKEYPRESGFDGEESMLSEAESQLLWEKATEGLWFEELPEEVFQALEIMLERESKLALSDLLKRLRNLNSFGVLNYLQDESSHPDSHALARVGAYVLERYDRLKKRRGAVDFNDLELGADRALENPDVCADYQRRFELVMVDEFQDTNPIQAKIIWRIIRPGATNLCIVGDPKQSIYRFRDADVTVFEECCARLPVRISLTANFRSRPGVIEFTNQVCQPAFEASQMDYESLVAKREVGEHEAVIQLNTTSPQELGLWVKSEVERGIPLSDMALLLSKIRGNEKWLQGLTQAGVPIAVESGGLFWDDPRVRELTAFLKWWDNPGNEFSGAVFLRAPWVGISDLTLDEWRKRDPSFRKVFLESSHPVASALKPFLDREESVRPGELLMALLINQQVEDEIGVPLLGLWHRVEELSSMRLDFHAVIAELTLAMEETRREKTVPPPRGAGQLVVLTIHGAKGLEFPHVILVDLPEKADKTPNAPLLYWDRTRGAHLGKRDADGERDKKDPVEIQWREEEKRKELAESKRLFYVALTRAEERLVLVFHQTPDLEVKTEGALDKDFWRGWILLSQVSIPVIEARDVKPLGRLEMPKLLEREMETRTRILPVPKRPRHSVSEWTTLSRCPRAYEWKFIRPVIVPESVAPSFKKAAPLETTSRLPLAANELGTRVHKALETEDHADLLALESEVGSSRFQAAPVIQWMAADAETRLSDERWSEIAFEVPFEGEAIVGSMDRLVKKGVQYSIVDFKVTAKAKSEEELLDSYQSQIELYALALGILEPAALGRTDACLVNFSPGNVQVVQVPIDHEKTFQRAKVTSQLSQKIIQGTPGEPKVGNLCRVCEFRGICPEGQRH